MRLTQQREEELMAIARKQVLRRYPNITPEELEYEAASVVDDWCSQDERDEGIEDSPCIESCDEGTGEGRFHGRI